MSNHEEKGLKFIAEAEKKKKSPGGFLGSFFGYLKKKDVIIKLFILN